MKGMEAFRGRRVLLLQGPVGPFFARLAADLRAAGAEVFKINFNAGDWLFYPRNAINYRGTMDAWPEFLAEQLSQLRIDTVLLFGDCRPIHVAAHGVAVAHGANVGVFEEGYIRPDYITFECFGVNGYSGLSRNPDDYANTAPPARKRDVGNTYWHMAWSGFRYFAAGILGKPWFPHYEHHRSLSASEIIPWVRSAWRKQKYRWSERGINGQLTTQYSKRFYLVPLQVFNDTQVAEHSRYESIEFFIEESIRSFAANAPADTLLVFKHHPMDRGYRDYSSLIRRLSVFCKTGDRVLYIHDQHLPSLLDHARGVVVINSTVGLSAIHHGTPVKPCGRAIYDIPGLTWQGALDEFWSNGAGVRPDRKLYRRFLGALTNQTQINGSFYKPLPIEGTRTGLAWGRGCMCPSKISRLRNAVVGMSGAYQS